MFPHLSRCHQKTSSSGRRTLSLGTLAIIGVCLILMAIFGYDVVWSALNIPVKNPHFADLRVLTGAAESMRLGFDPLYANPGDPWNRELNHARIWQWIISTLSIDSSYTTPIGILLCVLYFGGALLLFKDVDNITSLVMLFAIFSPAALLGIERANFDLLIFFIVCMGVLAAQRSALISLALILIGSALKFFPIFAIILFIRERLSYAIILCVTASILFLAYLLANLEDLPQILSSTDKGVTVLSYGSRSHSAGIELLPSFIPAISLLLTAFLFFVSLNETHSCDEKPSINLDSFRGGAAIYLGTFMLGNNWSYRLIFLILTIPQLIHWIRSDNKAIRQIALTTTIAIFYSLWAIFFDPIPISGALDELLNWVLLPLLFFLLLSSLPERIKHFMN